MSNEVDLTAYHYLYLSEEDIKGFPDEYKQTVPEEMFLPDIFQMEGLFRVSADATTCGILEDLSGEDFSCSWVDWFIIRLKEDKHEFI